MLEGFNQAVRKISFVIRNTKWLWELTMLISSSVALVLITQLNRLLDLLNSPDTSIQDYKLWIGTMAGAVVLTVVKQTTAWAIARLAGSRL